jgi:allantoinase
MQPSIYGPYRYLPITERKHFAWPGNARLALWVIPNIEFFHLDDPMPGVNNERVSGTHLKTPNVRNWAIRDYGNRVGIWRFFDVLARYGVRGTAALNSDICDYHPQIVDRGVKLGWEFMGHCQTNAKRLNELEPERERAAIHETLERIGKATGRKPVGWLGAGLAETWNTLDYLIEEGVQYVADWTSDDLPFRMDVGGKTLMSIPYSLQVNDTTQFYNQKASAEEFATIIKRQFDCLYAEGERAPRVMAIAIHPFVSGVPHWIGAIDAGLDYICSHADVWRATGSEIATHFAREVADE